MGGGIFGLYWKGFGCGCGGGGGAICDAAKNKTNIKLLWHIKLVKSYDIL